MKTIRRKLSLSEVKPDKQLTAEEGFVDCAPWWIVTEEIGAKYGTFGYVEFTPAATHELHTHPNADEVFFVLSGRGLVRSGDEMFEIEPGDTVFVPAGDVHYFRNTDEKENLVAVFAYLGAPSLEKAGYELKES